MATFTSCPQCGTRFDEEAHRLPVPEPGVDEARDSSTKVMAVCPQCGARVEVDDAR